MKDFIIVADGTFLVKEIISEAIQNKTIIALDAAADKLKRIGIMPHIIVGDFDDDLPSFMQDWGISHTLANMQDDAAPYQGNDGVLIVPKKDQNLTDLVKAIHYCDEQGAVSITLICALGGRLDHHEMNVRSLRSEYKPNRPILLHSEQQTLRYAKNETVVMRGEIGDKCGILAYPKGSYSSPGLEYENFELNMGFSESISNTLTAEMTTVAVTGEALIVMPPQLTSQRAFMQKSEAEQLEMLLRDRSRMAQNNR